MPHRLDLAILDSELAPLAEQRGRIVNDDRLHLLVEEIIAMYNGNMAQSMGKPASISQWGKFLVIPGKLQAVERVPLLAQAVFGDFLP